MAIEAFSTVLYCQNCTVQGVAIEALIQGLKSPHGRKGKERPWRSEMEEIPKLELSRIAVRKSSISRQNTPI